MNDGTDPQTAPAPDSSVIRELRAKLDEQSKALKERDTQLESLTTKLTDFERSKLETEERLRLELADTKKNLEDLKPLTKKVEHYEGTLKDLFEKRLASLPDEHRPHVEAITSIVTGYAEKLTTLDAATKLIPTEKAPAKAGVTPNPSNPTSPNPQAPPARTGAELEAVGWGFKSLRSAT